MPMKRPMYDGDFASRGMLETYARRAWKRFTDTSKGLTDLPTLEGQDALMAEENEIVGAEPVIVAVLTVDVDALLNLNEDNDWELKGAVGLDEVEPVRVNRKMCKL